MNQLKKYFAGAMAAALCLTTVGCSSEPVTVADDEIVMNVGGTDVTARIYNYYFLTTKYNTDGGDNTFWVDMESDNTYLKEAVDSSVKEAIAQKKMCDDAGIAITDEMNAQIDNSIAELKASFGSEEAFNNALASSFLTLDLYRELSLEATRTTELFKSTMGDEIRNNVKDNYIRAAHILIQLDDNNPDLEDATADALAKAEEVLEKVNNGEDFFALVDEYNEDPGMVNNRDGYYFTEGDMVTPFYEAAIALEENETSGLVETDYGYHIIKRLPMEESYIEANILDFVTTDQYNTFYAMIEETMNSMETTTTDAYNKINLENAIKIDESAAS